MTPSRAGCLPVPKPNGPCIDAIHATDARRRGEDAHPRGLRVWLTSEYEHDGLRVDGERILDRLIDLAQGRF